MPMASSAEESQSRLAGTEDQAPDKNKGPPSEGRQHLKERMDSSKEDIDVQNSSSGGANPVNRQQDSRAGGVIFQNRQQDSRAGGAYSQNTQQDRYQHEYYRREQYNDGYQQNYHDRRGGRNRGQFTNVPYDQRGQNNYNRGRGYQSYGRGAPGGYHGQHGVWRNQNMQSGSYQEQQYSSGNANQYQGRGRRDDNDEVFVSKTLSYILRHGAERQGFKLMKGGFLYVDDILKRTEKLHGVKVEEIEKIVKNNDKQRFALEKDENGRLMIRANQGHTMEVDDLKLEEITSADQVEAVIHGTYNGSWEIIKKSGLSRMGRNHVHFAPGEPGESGVISGMRNTSDVLIYIDIKKALDDGLKFYRSANNVILCPGDEKGIIYPCYFSGAVTRHPRHRLDFDNTIDKNTVKHEPLAKARKYSSKKNDKQTNIPVGLAVESDKKKKKKRKNKDKEVDGDEVETTGEMVGENSKPVAKRQATEEEKEDASVKNGEEAEDEQFGSMFDENGHQDGSEAMCEEDNNLNDTSSNEKTVEDDALNMCDKQIKDCQIDHTKEKQFGETSQDTTLSSIANSASTESTCSSVTTEMDGNEVTVISDIEASISAIDSLMEKKPEAMAVCCYGDKLGTKESKIHVLSLVTAECAYVYDIRNGNDLIKDGHVKELFDDTEINKVFNNIKPQSLSLLQECDIMLDGTPVWDLTLVYENCSGTVLSSDKKMIEKENLKPEDWDDKTIPTLVKDGELDKDTQCKLLQRGRDMLKLYNCFDKDLLKSVKKKVYDAVIPADGELAEKFSRLKEQRKLDRERKKKEEKQRKQEEQAHGQKKSGQAQGQKKSQKKRK